MNKYKLLVFVIWLCFGHFFQCLRGVFTNLPLSAGIMFKKKKKKKRVFFLCSQYFVVVFVCCFVLLFEQSSFSGLCKAFDVLSRWGTL